MNNEFKFKIKAYIYYLLVEPWTTKVSFPNFRTITWVLIVLSLIFRLEVLLIISVIVGVIFYLVYEFKSGKFIYWYRQRKYKGYKDAIKKVRREKKHEKEEKENR